MKLKKMSAIILFMALISLFMLSCGKKEEVTSGHDLTHYMERPFKGANSVFVHPGESGGADLTVNIEAYDETFYEVTAC